MAQTAEETGLPGRPRTGVVPRRPKISGLPGRMAIFQKVSDRPRTPRASWTRSWSPTEAPPLVTRTSRPSTWARLAASAPGSSRLMPRATGSPPHRVTMAASVVELELTISPGPGLSPGQRSSSPVARMPTRGRRRTGRKARPMKAARPSSPAPRDRPAAGAGEPAGPQDRAGLEAGPPGGEVEAGGADELADLHAAGEADEGSVALGVLLDGDGVRTLGHDAAGEDADGLAGGERAGEGVAGGRLADHLERAAGLLEVGGADGVAVHGGDGGGRLVAAGAQVVGQD